MLNEENIKIIASRIEQELDGLLKSHVPSGYVSCVVETELGRILTDTIMEKLKETIKGLAKSTKQDCNSGTPGPVGPVGARGYLGIARGESIKYPELYHALSWHYHNFLMSLQGNDADKIINHLLYLVDYAKKGLPPSGTY